MGIHNSKSEVKTRNKTRVKMKVLQVFVLVISISAISPADNINMIEIKTSDCEDCGMGTFGEIRMQVCNSMSECCVTSSLDNSFENDFNKGAVDQFDEHSDLNQCDQFDMKNSPGTQIRMTVFHEGSDGWSGDWVNVYTNEGQYQCQLSDFLDGDTSETGHDCRAF